MWKKQAYHILWSKYSLTASIISKKKVDKVVSYCIFPLSFEVKHDFYKRVLVVEACKNMMLVLIFASTEHNFVSKTDNSLKTLKFGDKVVNNTTTSLITNSI